MGVQLFLNISPRSSPHIPSPQPFPRLVHRPAASRGQPPPLALASVMSRRTCGRVIVLAHRGAWAVPLHHLPSRSARLPSLPAHLLAAPAVSCAGWRPHAYVGWKSETGGCATPGILPSIRTRREREQMGHHRLPLPDTSGATSPPRRSTRSRGPRTALTPVPPDYKQLPRLYRLYRSDPSPRTRPTGRAGSASLSSRR
jgi:hypothetical protein